MDTAKIISQLGNALIIALCLFMGIFIFNLYSDDTTVSARLAYTVIFSAAIFTLLYTFKVAVIWFIKSIKK